VSIPQLVSRGAAFALPWIVRERIEERSFNRTEKEDWL